MNATLSETKPTPNRRAEFAAIAHQHEATLMRAAKRMCGIDHDLAQDIVQDTFVSAYRAYLDGRFDGRNPGAWLMRILTNAYLYAKRKDRTDSGLESEAVANSDAGAWNSSLPSPDHRLLQGVFDENLERALMGLPESQRVCVLLADIEEMPYADVAEMLNVPIGTVRSRLNRARLQMLQTLQDLKKADQTR